MEEYRSKLVNFFEHLAEKSNNERIRDTYDELITLPRPMNYLPPLVLDGVPHVVRYKVIENIPEKFKYGWGDYIKTISKEDAKEFLDEINELIKYVETEYNPESTKEIKGVSAIFYAFVEIYPKKEDLLDALKTLAKDLERVIEGGGTCLKR